MASNIGNTAANVAASNVSAVAPSSNSTNTSGTPMNKLLYGLRTAGGLCGVALIILGILMVLGSAFNPQKIINGVYQIIFGGLAIISELRLAKVLKHFKFLTHFLGLGLFYIFIGGLALGGEWYEILVAVVVLGVGIIYCLLGCLCRKFGQEDFRQFQNTEYSEQNAQEERQAVLANEVPSDAFEYQPPISRPISEVDTESENSMIRSSSSSKAWPSQASSTNIQISASTARTAAAAGGYSLSSEQAAAAASAATAAANNPFARAAAGAAARSAYSGVMAGASAEEVKKNSVESAVHAVNPFADFH